MEEYTWIKNLNNSETYLSVEETQDKTWYESLNKPETYISVGVIAMALVFRMEMIGFTISLLRKAMPTHISWINDFEKYMTKPLSWILLILLVYLAIIIMGWERDWIKKVVIFAVGIPLIWAVIRFFQFITVLAIRFKGWDRSSSKDDYSRVVIVTEGISLIKYFVVALIVFFLYLDTLEVDLTKIIIVVFISLEITVAFGSYTWVKNIVGGLVLIVEEHIRTGLYAKILGHEGVIEAVYLRHFMLRRKDKGLMYIPNGLLLDNYIEVHNASLERRILIPIHVDHSTSTKKIRQFIQEADRILSEEVQSINSDENNVSNFRISAPRGSKSKLKSGLLASDEPIVSRYWVNVEGVYEINVVFYTRETQIKQYATRKSEVILLLTKLLQRLDIEMHQPLLSDSHANEEDTGDAEILEP